MNLTDTHAHLYWEDFKEDFDEVIKRAINAGITTIINVGVEVEKSKEALRQVQGKLANIPGLKVYSTIGIHPHESSTFSYDQIEQLEQIYLSDPKTVVAVGECGLDYYENNNYNDYKGHNVYNLKNKQKALFKAQINLAKKIKLPLIVHCRQAWDDTIEMTKDHFGIYHCYSGLPHTTNYILQTTNFLVSFAGNLTYPKNDYLREAAKLLPLERIVLETDCPFLPPQSKRGQRNEPANMLEIAQLVAELKGVSLDEVATQTTENVVRSFAL
ncbi:MAG: Uncharacterized protein G01um10147_506 [Microgenomates group bacterium Gr01-1014_7]|nr:MAG: Uncharacterized protein G01um10147_506 [Microgenomates group bacterium Gr01-1014_7]